MSNTRNEHLSEIELWEYVDHPTAFAHYERHLSSCSACALLVSEIKLLETDIRDLPTPAPSAQFTSQVVSKVMAKAGSYPWFIRSVAASFSFAFGLTIYQLYRDGASIQLNDSLFYPFIMVVVVASFLIRESVHRWKSLNALGGLPEKA